MKPDRIVTIEVKTSIEAMDLEIKFFNEGAYSVSTLVSDDGSYRTVTAKFRGE